MKNYYLFLTAIVFLLIPVSATRPMTSLFAEELNASMIQIGFITACYSVTPFLLAVSVGRFIDKVGERLPIMIGSSGMFISLLMPFFHPHLGTLLISQLILGGSQLIVLVSVQNGIAGAVSEDRRDKAIASMSLFASIGLMIGPLIGGYLTEQIGFQKSYLVFSIISTVSFVIAIFIESKKKEIKSIEKAQDLPLKKLLRIPGLKRSIFISMINLAAIDIYNVYYPLYSSSIGMSPSEIGWVLTITAFSSVFVRIFLSGLVEKYGRTKVLTTFMYCGAFAFAVIPFVNNLISIMIITSVLGFGLGVAQPLTTILSYNLAPEGHTGEVLGIRLAGNRLSQVVIPFLFAGISNITGLGTIFILEALVISSGAMLAKGLAVFEGDPPIKKPKRVKEV